MVRRIFMLLGALAAMFTTMFFAHLGIKLPDEQVWASLPDIWNNYVIALTVFFSSSYPLLLALGVLAIMGLIGAWVGKAISRIFSR